MVKNQFILLNIIIMVNVFLYLCSAVGTLLANNRPYLLYGLQLITFRVN